MIKRVSFLNADFTIYPYCCMQACQAYNRL